MRRARKNRTVTKYPAANKDLRDIWEYIADHSELRADSFIRKLDEKFFALARNPGIGRTRDELGTGLHSIPVGNYLLFYCILKDGIGIVRVLHGSRDIRSFFFESDNSDFEA